MNAAVEHAPCASSSPMVPWRRSASRRSRQTVYCRLVTAVPRQELAQLSWNALLDRFTRGDRACLEEVARRIAAVHAAMSSRPEKSADLIHHVMTGLFLEKSAEGARSWSDGKAVEAVQRLVREVWELYRERGHRGDVQVTDAGEARVSLAQARERPKPPDDDTEAEERWKEPALSIARELLRLRIPSKGREQRLEEIGRRFGCGPRTVESVLSRLVTLARPELAVFERTVLPSLEREHAGIALRVYALVFLQGMRNEKAVETMNRARGAEEDRVSLSKVKKCRAAILRERDAFLYGLLDAASQRPPEAAEIQDARTS